MNEELPIKQQDFWRLLSRENFILSSFHACLRYRLPAADTQYIYVQVNCDDKTGVEHAQQYISSYLQPKHMKSINYPPKYKDVLCDNELLNRLMKEYLVHIEIKDEDNSHQVIFHSSSLTVLFLAIDDFRKVISNVVVLNKPSVEDTKSLMDDAASALASLSTNFERQLTTVDEQDQFDESEDSGLSSFTALEEPRLKIAFPGAELSARTVPFKQFIVKPNKTKSSTTQPISDINDNDLVREMRQKLKGQKLRDVIIDGANIGRTYGDSEFSARGIKLAVDLFQAYGYPDSKIVVILPAHYLSKDKDHIFPDLIRRKIVHKAFQQKIEDKNKRFYDDRLIIDMAVIRNGIILSNDYYRDIYKDAGEAVRKTIRERLLCYRFIGDNLCLPDPVSEGGSPLNVFLSM